MLQFICFAFKYSLFMCQLRWKFNQTDIVTHWLSILALLQQVDSQSLGMSVNICLSFEVYIVPNLLKKKFVNSILSQCWVCGWNLHCLPVQHYKGVNKERSASYNRNQSAKALLSALRHHTCKPTCRSILLPLVSRLTNMWNNTRFSLLLVVLVLLLIPLGLCCGTDWSQSGQISSL